MDKWQDRKGRAKTVHRFVREFLARCDLVCINFVERYVRQNRKRSTLGALKEVSVPVFRIGVLIIGTGLLHAEPDEEKYNASVAEFDRRRVPSILSKFIYNQPIQLYVK